MSKLVCGIGTNDVKGVKVNGKILKSYTAWINMLRRCYSEKQQEKQPTYIGCGVYIDWLTFSNYKKWHDQYYVDGCAVDKDILIPGNKEYNPVACRFIPQHINSLLLDSGAIRGDYMIGVTLNQQYPHKSSKKFRSDCNTFNITTGMPNKKHYNGYYYTELEAHLAYKSVKEANVKEVAKYYYDKQLISDEIYTALMIWEIFK